MALSTAWAWPCSADHERTPTKPTLDGEPNYEHHPVVPNLRPWKPKYGRFTDYDARKQACRRAAASLAYQPAPDRLRESAIVGAGGKHLQAGPALRAARCLGSISWPINR
jgi:hypothetical protein